MKAALRRLLSRHGWFLRRLGGLPWGVDFGHDWTRLRLGQPEIIFDVGAHKGESVSAFKEFFPAARIFSFEPVAANYDVLQLRHGLTPLVKCLNVALGDAECEADILLGKDSQTHSLRQCQGDAGAGRARVKVTTCDTVMRELQLDRVNLLKVDTEGYELAVLEGASAALSECRIDAILCEASIDKLDQQHSRLSDIVKFLEPLGYSVVAVYDQTVWRTPDRLAYFNTLFVREVNDL
jgi:FkbM family methyltransferase